MLAFFGFQLAFTKVYQKFLVAAGPTSDAQAAAIAPELTGNDLAALAWSLARLEVKPEDGSSWLDFFLFLLGMISLCSKRVCYTDLTLAWACYEDRAFTWRETYALLAALHFNLSIWE